MSTSLFTSLLLALSASAFFKHESYGEYRNSLEPDSLIGDTFLRFEQPRDHFNPSDLNKFNQMYFVDDSRYKVGGPVFLSLTGE
jgi:hypothetical protein